MTKNWINISFFSKRKWFFISYLSLFTEYKNIITSNTYLFECEFFLSLIQLWYGEYWWFPLNQNMFCLCYVFWFLTLWLFVSSYCFMEKISMYKSNYGILYLRLCQIFIVSRYFTGMTVSYFFISSVKNMQHWKRCPYSKHSFF